MINQSEGTSSDATIEVNLCHNILIADDSDGTREALIAALRAQGYIAIGARNGKEAFEKLSKLDGATLIFMDLMMPVMDGWQVLEKMSAMPSFANNKVVTISAVAPGTRTDARAIKNTVGRIQKPLAFKQVLQLVQKYVGRPGARQVRPESANAHP